MLGTFGAPSTGTSAFGAPSTGTSAFGAPSTGTSAFGAPSTGTSAFGSGRVEADMEYSQLPEHAKAEIDRTYKEFLNPMSSTLDEIGRQSEPLHLKNVGASQRRLQMQVRHLKDKQKDLLREGSNSCYKYFLTTF